MTNILSLLQASWVEALGWTLIHLLWQGVLIALVWRIGLLCWKSAQSQYRVSVVALFLMGLSVPVTYLWQQSLQVVSPEWASGQGATLVRETPDSPTNLFGEVAEPLTLGQEVAQVLKPYLPWLVFGWFVGATLLFLRFLGGWSYLEYLRRKDLHLIPEKWHSKLQTHARQMGIHRQVRVLESYLIDLPMTLGYFKPVILIPMGMVSGLQPEQLEAILLHELAHIRRADYLINLLQTCIETVLFYHPIVWWISRHIRESREHCCDDLALQQGYDRWQYAQALLQLNKHSVSLKTHLAMSALGNKHSQLTRRIHRLFGRGTPRNLFSLRALVLLGLLAGCLFTWAHQKPLISPPQEFTFFGSETEKIIRITPQSTDAELKQAQMQLQPYGIVFESITRIKGQGITEFALSYQQEKPISFNDFQHIDIVIPANPTEKVKFHSDGVISVEWESPVSPSSLIEKSEARALPERKVTTNHATNPVSTPEALLKEVKGTGGVDLVIQEKNIPIGEILALPAPVFLLEGTILEALPGEQIPAQVRQLWGSKLITAKIVNGNMSFVELETEEGLFTGDTVWIQGATSISFAKATPVIEIKALPASLAMQKLGEKGKNGAILFRTVETPKESILLKKETEALFPQKDGFESQIRIRQSKDLLSQPNPDYPLIIIDGKRWEELKDQYPTFPGRDQKGMPNFPKGFEQKIESINVWKDEKALEKYGKEGANGVIEITLHPHALDQFAKATSPNGNNSTEKDGYETQIKFRKSNDLLSRDKSNYPLIIIDGMRWEELKGKYPAFPDLDEKGMPKFPKGFEAQIESLSVLKDEKALEKYGQDGTNGVIEMTLKPHALDRFAKSSLFDAAVEPLWKTYPNPSGERFQTELQLEQKSQIRIEVVDVNGRVLAILADEVKQAGNHTFNWDATNYPEGLYLLNLEVEGQKWTRKLVKKAEY